MQTAKPNADLIATPRVYRNRPYSPAFNAAHLKPLCDVLYFVDADCRFQEGISTHLLAAGIEVIGFATASDYLVSHCGDTAACCLVLNTHLPDISGFELQRRLAEKANPPVIFISDQFDVPSTVRAMKAGAIDCLAKPVDVPVLLVAVQAAFIQDRRQRRKRAELQELQLRFSLLTPRERQVLSLVVGGLLNKQAASVLGISEVTLQIHRSQVMRKTRAESLADLVRMAMKLRIPYWSGDQAGTANQTKPAQFGLQNAFTALAQSAVQ